MVAGLVAAFPENKNQRIKVASYEHIGD